MKGKQWFLNLLLVLTYVIIFGLIFLVTNWDKQPLRVDTGDLIIFGFLALVILSIYVTDRFKIARLEKNITQKDLQKAFAAIKYEVVRKEGKTLVAKPANRFKRYANLSSFLVEADLSRGLLLGPAQELKKIKATLALSTSKA